MPVACLARGGQHLSPRMQYRKGSPCQGLPTGQNHLPYALCLPWLLCGLRVEPRLAEPQDKARRDHSSESWPWSSGKERAGGTLRAPPQSPEDGAQGPPAGSQGRVRLRGGAASTQGSCRDTLRCIQTYIPHAQACMSLLRQPCMHIYAHSDLSPSMHAYRRK